MEIQKSKAAKDFYEKAQNLLGDLYSRWLDERGYEDIKDYQKPLDPIAKECGVVITKMTKRPFGCQFTVDGKHFSFNVGLTWVQYKRIA